MKICHKKNFWAGVGMLALGILNLATALWRRDLDASAVVLVVALVLLGGSSLLRGLSPKLAREDRVEERDERNQLVNWKSRSAALRWTRLLTLGLLALLLVAGKLTGEESLLAMGVGVAFAWAVSLFAEIGAFLYYDSRN